MRVAARTTLVLVLCFCALVGTSAQASYFSSFFKGKAEDDSDDVPDEAPYDAMFESDTADAKMRALIDEAESFGMDLGDDLEDLLQDDLEDDTREPVDEEIYDAEFGDVETYDEETFEEEAIDEEVVDSIRDPISEPIPDPEPEIPEPVPDIPDDIPNFDDEDDAVVLARMAAVEAGILELEDFSYDDDDIKEEWLDGGGDGEEVPTVRAPRTLLTMRDDEEKQTVDGNKKQSPQPSKRKLLIASVSGDNTKWVGFDDMPFRLQDIGRSGPATRVARDHGEAFVTRAGGYWQAARFNKVERVSRNKRPVNFGKGSGEGTLSGPKGGINQHDRTGVNKASGWPGDLYVGKVSTERYPGTQSRDITQALQPHVVKVTSYSPSVRSDSFSHRKKVRLSKLWCVTGDNSRSCSDTSIFTVSKNDLKVGDLIRFDNILGVDRSVLLDTRYTVDTVASDGMSFTTDPAIDSRGGALSVDVTYGFVVAKKITTRANPDPLYSQRSFSYEGLDHVYVFVYFSEAVVVSGTPKLVMNTGDHFESGATNGIANFIGGGFGEKKTFWKNDERNPILSKGLSEQDDVYSIHDGGCTLSNVQNHGSTDSDCVLYSSDGVTCSCADYSGITHSTDAQVRTRRVHHFVVGDVVELKGVTGSDADLLNKRHTVGTVSGTGSSGTNLLTFEPPLDLVGRAFDARDATVTRINGGQECRASNVDTPGSFGANYCISGSEDTDFRDENRVEQYMDNVLAFALRVNNTGGQNIELYDQTDLIDKNNKHEPMLTAKLEYSGRNALQLTDQSVTIKRACFDVFQVVQVECGVHTIITVAGKHRLLPGNYVTLEGIGAEDSESDLPTSVKKTWNREMKVHALPTDSGIAMNRVDWAKIWDASPYWGADVSKFQVDFDSSNGQGVCANAGGTDGASPPTVSKKTTRARKTRDSNVLGSSSHDSRRKCIFSDVDLKLPKPGYAGSLGWNKIITLGRAHVVNVTARTQSGSVFGHNGGFGIRPSERLTVTRNIAGPDILEVVVSFSEPVYASCGTDDDEWTTIEHAPGVRLTGCESIRLVLRTSLDSALGGSSNFNTTTGTPGTEIFPTSFLAPRDLSIDKPDELVFQYVVRRGDATEPTGLQYADEFAMEVGCAVAGGGGCDSISKIRRLVDNAPAGTRLPPTRRDDGRCVHGEPQCATTTADHTRSLAGTVQVVVDADF